MLAILLKKETPAGVFSCEFCENFKNIFTEHLRATASIHLFFTRTHFIKTLRLRTNLTPMTRQDAETQKTSRVRNISNQLKLDTQMSDQ